MVLIMLVTNTCVRPGDLISANNAAITRPYYLCYNSLASACFQQL